MDRPLYATNTIVRKIEKIKISVTTINTEKKKTKIFTWFGNYVKKETKFFFVFGLSTKKGEDTQKKETQKKKGCEQVVLTHPLLGGNNFFHLFFLIL